MYISLYIILCVADLSYILDLVAGEVGVVARVDVIVRDGFRHVVHHRGAQPVNEREGVNQNSCIATDSP